MKKMECKGSGEKGVIKAVQEHYAEIKHTL